MFKWLNGKHDQLCSLLLLFLAANTQEYSIVVFLPERLCGRLNLLVNCLCLHIDFHIKNEFPTVESIVPKPITVQSRVCTVGTPPQLNVAPISLMLLDGIFILI